MTRKEKERNIQLTRYILCALMLGNGLLFAPMAEADEQADTTISGSDAPSKYSFTKLSDNSQAVSTSSGSSINRYVVDFSNTDTGWKNIGLVAVGSKTGYIYLEYGLLRVKGGTLGAAYGVNNTSSGTASYGEVDISGGSVDFACGVNNTGTGATSNGKVVISGGSVGSAYGAYSINGPSDSTVEMSAGTANFLYGGQGTAGIGKGNKVEVSGTAVVNNKIYGQFSSNGAAGDLENKKGNTVNISGGTINGAVYGGYGGSAHYNTVTINSGATVNGNIYGGYAMNGNARDNTVTINGGNLSSNVIIYGGWGDSNTPLYNDNNKIYINAAVNIKGIVGCVNFNSGATGTNTLYLGKTGISIGSEGISGLNTIAITSGVSFTNNSTVLSTSGTINYNPVLDITGATGLKNSTTVGSMTLLTSTGTNSVSKVKYGSGSTATISSTGVTVKDGTAKTSADKGVTLNYTEGAHTVSKSGNTIKYNILGQAPVSSIDLGAMTWGQGRTSSGFTYNDSTTINADNLTFTGSITGNPINQSMTLLSGASGIKSYSGTGAITKNNLNLSAQYKDATATNGITYTGVATTGKVTSDGSAGTVTFTFTGAQLNSLDLSDWNGGTHSLLSGWSKKTGGISVSGVFTKPTLAAGASKDIISTDTANFFSDATIADDIIYKAGGDSFSDTVAGVTLAGTKAGGVKVTNSGKNLTYFGEMNDVNSVSLGSMTWGTPRVASSAYDFSGVTNIDASGLTFTGTATLDSLNDSTNLLTGATGLTSDTITQPTNKTFDIAYTDNTSKITYKGQATDGNVSRDGTNLKYTISAGTVNEIDLGNWNGHVAPTLPGSWNTPTTGVAVDTGDFDAPAGDSNVDIYSTETEGFFNEENITGDKKYKDHEEMPDDPKNGVTISGTKSGGIAPSDDGITPTTSGKRLTYFAESTTGSKISLGEVAWNKAGIARTLTGNYDFSALGNNDVDATGLTFTFANSEDATSVYKIATGDTMTLLSGATGLNADLTVAGSPVSQKVSYGINNVANLSGTLTGNVTTAAGTVNYEVTGKTLDSVDISNWDGATNENLDASWTNNASGINVTGSGFTAPTAIGDTPILTASDGFFSSAIIADNIKYQPSGSYSEVDSNITLSGSRGSGIQTNNNGSQLVYSIGAAFINNIKLGAVNYNKGGTWIDKSDTTKYNFSNLSSLDTTGFSMSMTDDQKKTAVVNDTMTLVKGNSTMGDIAAQDTGSSNYTYTASYNDGNITVDGAVSGSVSASGNNVLYTVSGNKATSLNFNTVKWNSTHNRGSEINYKDALVDSSNIHFTNIDNLLKDDVMTLVSNYGGGINKTRAGIFTLDDGRTGKGYAYYDSGTDSLMYKVTLGAGETQETVNAVNKKTVVDLPDGDEYQGTVKGGEAQGDGESTGNEVDVKGKIVTNTDGTGGDVFGGTSEDGPSQDNKADVEDSVIEGDVIGGESDGGPSRRNQATTRGSKVGGGIIGGHSNGGGQTIGNTADVDGTEVGGSVNGGKSEGDGDSNENKTNVKNGSIVSGDVTGGQSEGGNTNKNETTVSGGSTVNGDVTGGKNNGDGTANENKTNVSGSKVVGDVTGGQSKNGATNNNDVTVNGGSVGGDVTGGKTENGSAYNNNVTLDGGADITGKVYGGFSQNGSVDGNVVTVKNATVRDYIYGGKSAVRSSNDLVFFHEGSVLGIIGGGCDEAVNNQVTLLKGGVEEHVIGGFANTTATGNKVTMTGGTVNGSVIGGYASTTSDGNSVYLGGGTVKGETFASTALGGITINGGVYGGYTSGTGTTANNNVYIFGDADVSATSLNGGNNGYAGNKLYVGLLSDGTPSPWTGGGQLVKDITNFEAMDFSVVPWSTDKTAINITDGSNSDLSMTTVSAKEVTFTGTQSLNKGASMTLLDQSSVAAAKQAVNVTTDSKFKVGAGIEGTGTLSQEDNGNVIYTVDNVAASEQTHNTLMGAEAGMVALAAGNDFINSAIEGLGDAKNMGDDGISSYAKIGGGQMKQETGSHINVNTWNAILALGHKNVKKESTTEYGAFFEYGTGNYTTHNGDLRGDGSVRYTGGGVLGKWEDNTNGFYVEGGFRAGTVHEDANNLLRDANRGYSYSTDAPYKGFHIGLGKKIAMGKGNTLDLYAKYIFNRKDGVSFNAGGNSYRLDDVTSQIIRLGGRYTMKRDKWSFYAGAAYEHELDGRAHGWVDGIGIRGADIGGGSFRGELGATVTPDAGVPLTLDFNLTGYAGNKQGISGGLSLTYSF